MSPIMMEQQVATAIEHMANSHLEMVRILEAERDMAVHMANLISEIPDVDTSFKGLEEATKNAMLLTENLTAYLTGIAELEEALADNLGAVMKELNPRDDGE